MSVPELASLDPAIPGSGETTAGLTAPGAAAPHPMVLWQAERAAPRAPWQLIPLPTALLRGLRCRCPACGETQLFAGYLRVRRECEACGAPLGLARADDAPPYFTIVAVGHLVVPSMLMAERVWQPSLWVAGTVWGSLALGLTLALLRPIKGATVGLMLKLGLVKSEAEA
jgi:uncharacterized protein (DUF983 family)